MRVTDIHVSDLDGDGLVDAYLVSPQANMALRGDGQGYLQDITAELGLADRGAGVSAERIDLDGMAPDELVLHNTTGDVVFWATGRDFRRDANTPDVSQPTGENDVAALQQLVVRAAELLALDPEEQIVLGLDETGRLFVELGPWTPGRCGAPTPVDGVPNDTQGPSGFSGLTMGSHVGLVGTALTPTERQILSHMSIVMLDDGFGNLVNETIRIEGVNVQIVNGMEATNGYPSNPDSVDPAQTLVNGAGNLIIGYNRFGNPNGDERTGSHNVVVGHGNSYTSFGGLVGGNDNRTSGPFASISGGLLNSASGAWSAVSGGWSNTASGARSSVSGGRLNAASGYLSAVSGWKSNTASGLASSVSGGYMNTASAWVASVSGGELNTASGVQSSVSGGNHNIALGEGSSVSGGRYNRAYGKHSSISGGMDGFSDSLARGSSISGGMSNYVYGIASSVSGGMSGLAYGNLSSVSGGRSNHAVGELSSVSGGDSNRARGRKSSVSGGFQRTT